MSGTTHNSPRSGHGPKIRRQRFAIASPATKRNRSLSTAAFLKTWGSRPENKSQRLERAA